MKKRKSRFARSQRMTIATGILFFVVIIIVLQLWLFTSTMNAYLGGDSAILLPAAIASLICLGLNVGLLWYLYGVTIFFPGIFALRPDRNYSTSSCNSCKTHNG